MGGFLIAGLLLLAANWEADRQERVRMDSFRERITDLALVSETIISEELHEFDNSLLVLRQAYIADPERFPENIRLLRSGPLADSELLVVLVDRDGYLAYTDTPDVKPHLYLGDRKYFRFFADGGKDCLYIDEPTFGRVTKRYSLPLARPIFDKQGDFAGVVALSVKQESIASFEPRLQLSRDTAITVVNQGGAVVSRSRDLEKVQGTKLPADLLAPMLQGPVGIFLNRSAADGLERFIAHRHVENEKTPLIVYVEVLSADVLRQIAMQRVVLMLGAGFTALVVIILMIVSLKGRKTSAQLVETLRRNREQEYDTLTGTSLDGFWIVDASARILDTNATFCSMLGYSKEEILGLTVVDIEVTQSPLQIADRLRRGREMGTDRFQTQYRRKNGSIIDVEVSAQHIDGSNSRYFVFVRDITERKRDEESLQTLTRRQNAILSAVPDIIVEVDTDKRVTWLNSAGIDFYGEDATGKEAASFFIGNQDTYEAVQPLFAGTTDTVSVESWQRRKDGAHRLLAWRCKVLEDENGVITGALSTARDITELNRAEEERKAHIRFLESLELVDRAIKQETDAEQMLWNIVRVVFSIFDCDRAWLLFPCNPEAPSFRIPVEITKPQYPGAKVLDVDVLMSPGEAQNMREALDADGPVTYTDGTERPVTTAKMFGVQSQMFVPIFPKLGDPWVFGMHQCSYPRIWTEMEKNLFKEIARRVSDGLSSVLYLRELQENEERFRATFEQAAVGIAHVASDGRWMRVNEKLCDIVGYTREELLHKTFQEITWHQDLDSDMDHFRQLLEGQIQTYSMEMRYIRKGGTIVWTNLTVSIVRHVSNDPAYFIAVIEDISERKLAEENLKKSEGHLRTLVQTIPDLVWLKDPNGVYLSCNEIFERLFGAKQADIVGKTDYDFVDRELADFFREHDRKAIAAGKPTSNEECVTFADDGHLVLLETIKTPMYDDRGTLIGVLGIGRDITERKKAEEEKIKLVDQLQQSQKMDAIGQLAGGVAHDFNNMLSVILGHAEMVMDKTDPSQPVYSDLEEIRKAATRSAEITRQLLAFARKQTVAPRVLDLNETVEGMLKMLRRLIGENIDLAWLPGSGLWPVKIDPSQIDQILANLCVNARAAIVGVGKVTVETGNSVFDSDYCEVHAGFVPGEYVRISVSDTGCGMDKETLDHIFEPFFTTKGVGEGTGLGLATVYGAIKQNNGFITTYSAPSQGTTFSIYLPRYRGKIEQMANEELPEPALRGSETILLVEDEPTILKMAATMLHRLGYSVLAAKAPADAIRLAEEYQGKIDLVLTDVIMPEMNGRDLAKILLTRHPGMKCLFMSGYAANIVAKQSILDEGMHFIQKPFSKKDIAAQVRKTLDDETTKIS
jgi:PAS domain S-box-containing protein